MKKQDILQNNEKKYLRKTNKSVLLLILAMAKGGHWPERQILGPLAGPMAERSMDKPIKDDNFLSIESFNFMKQMSILNDCPVFKKHEPALGLCGSYYTKKQIQNRNEFFV